MVWSMLRPDLFGGFATHAGDALFDVTLGAELAPAAQALRNLYGGSFEAFWADFRSGRPVFENRTDPLLQNVYATAAAFSAAADGTVELPFSLDTGIVLARGLRSLARLGPGSHGPETRRSAGRAPRDLDRCGPPATSTASTSPRWRSATPSPPPARPRTSCISSFSTAAIAGSADGLPRACRI